MEKINFRKAILTINKSDGSKEEIDLSNAELIKIEREKEPNNWHRQKFNRNKDGLVHPQIIQDSIRIAESLSYINENGKHLAKYNYWSHTLQPKPRPFQKRGGKKTKKQKNMYVHYMKEDIEKNKDGLELFRNKKIIVYLCFYLRKKNYDSSDLDNYAELILDVLKLYCGDDSKIVTLLLDKKMLYEDYDKSDLDFLENTLIVVTDEKAKQDFLKSI